MDDGRAGGEVRDCFGVRIRIEDETGNQEQNCPSIDYN